MAKPLTMEIRAFDGQNYNALISPVGWKIADYEAYATAYAQANNVTVTIWKAFEDWNTDGTSTSYAQS